MKTKAQISFTVTAQLISAFVSATQTVQFLYFLNPKLPASSCLLCSYSSVCVRPVRKPHCWFSCATAQLLLCSQLSCVEALLTSCQIPIARKNSYWDPIFLTGRSHISHSEIPYFSLGDPIFLTGRSYISHWEIPYFSLGDSIFLTRRSHISHSEIPYFSLGDPIFLTGRSYISH